MVELAGTLRSSPGGYASLIPWRVRKKQKIAPSYFHILTVPADKSAIIKTPSNDEVFIMVELAGTAPASAGLSWLNLSYRYSLFGLSRRPEKNKQITDLPQFQD